MLAAVALLDALSEYFLASSACVLAAIALSEALVALVVALPALVAAFSALLIAALTQTSAFFYYLQHNLLHCLH